MGNPTPPDDERDDTADEESADSDGSPGSNDSPGSDGHPSDSESGANPEESGAIDANPEDEKVENVDKIIEEVEKKRSVRGWAAIVVTVIAILFSAFQMWISARGYIFEVTVPLLDTYRIGSLQQLQVNAIHVAFALVLAFLLYPASSGEGRIARTLGRVPPLVRKQFGPGNPVTRAVEGGRRALRWAFVDEQRERVAPADVLLAMLAFLPPFYMVTEFDEVRDMRVWGLESGRPLDEVYPFLEPIAVGPLGEMSWAFLLGILGVLLVLEATRRALGFLLMSLVAMFIVYARLGHHIPRDAPGIGVFSITPTPWSSLIRDLWYNTEAGIFGVPVTVSVRFIYIFILFGAFLEMSGAGKWFIDIAYSATGTRRGGPAKASVVSSGFMGMLSGSSVANTVTTGAFTIPLMKRSGYSPEFAGAVESSVSSGGQMLPPVMGAAAFLIVEFTGTPYRIVIIAALLPALAFFFGMWVMVHFEAVRRGVGGLPRSELPAIGPELRTGWFYLLPVALLLYFLVIARLSINRAGWFTIVATIALIAVVAAYDERTRLPIFGAFLVLTVGSVWTQTTAGVSLYEYLLGQRETAVGLQDAIVSAIIGGLGPGIILVSLFILFLRPGMESSILDLDEAVDSAAETVDEKTGKKIATTQPGRFVSFVLKSMEAGARTATMVVIAVAAAGVIPGVISVTGLGPNLTRLVVLASRESFILLLVLAGISAVILGMGMPTTVMYIILVSVLGGALEEFGVALLLAHLFVLYFGLMADVTPPVMVAAYAASGVAKSRPFPTGKLAFLLSLNKITVPFAFVLYPGIALIQTGESPTDISLIGWAEVTDLSFFIPEVAIPILGMFAGVYALSVTIIGYQITSVSYHDRLLYSVSSMLLMIPALVLLAAEAALIPFGISAELNTLTLDMGLRAVGVIMLAVLIEQNRRKARHEKTTPEADVTSPVDD